MEINPKNGLVGGARLVISPNADLRPPGEAPELLVIHNISLPPGEFGGTWIDDLFLNRLDPDAHPYFAGIHTLRVSAHTLIRRDGSLTQYVPFHLRAWHAGQSNYRGRARCNDFSIGIELEGADETPFTDAQYAALSELTVALLRSYPGLSKDRIAGHSEIAPGRKTDPGPAFDWKRYRAELDVALSDA